MAKARLCIAAFQPNHFGCDQSPQSDVGVIRLRSGRDLTASKAQSFRQGEYRTRYARRQKIQRNCFGVQSLRLVQSVVGRPAMAGATVGRGLSPLPLAHPWQMTTSGNGGQAAQYPGRRWASAVMVRQSNKSGKRFDADFGRRWTMTATLRTTLTLSRSWPILREGPRFALNALPPLNLDEL